MEICPHYSAVGRDRAIAVLTDHRKWPGAIRSLGLAEMDLIAGERGPARDMGSAHPGERLVGDERGLNAKKSKARHRPGRAFEAVQIVDRLAEHLITAAQPKYGAAPPH